MTHTSDALLFCDHSFSVICVTVLVIFNVKFWAFLIVLKRQFNFVWSSIWEMERAGINCSIFVCLVLNMPLKIEFWALSTNLITSKQQKNPPANVQLLLTTSCRSKCQLSVFAHTYTSYLSLCLHSRNLRPRNFTPLSAQISDKRLCKV